MMHLLIYLFAQTLTGETPVDWWVQPVVQLATATGFGGLVWYLVVRHIPAIEARHRDERKEFVDACSLQRSDFLNRLERRDLLIRELHAETRTTIHEFATIFNELTKKIERLEK